MSSDSEYAMEWSGFIGGLNRGSQLEIINVKLKALQVISKPFPLADDAQHSLLSYGLQDSM